MRITLPSGTEAELDPAAGRVLDIIAAGEDRHVYAWHPSGEAVKGFPVLVEDPSKVDEGIRAALAHDGPVVIDAVVNRTELAMPPSITKEMAEGFSLYMVKAIMSGRGDEVIDLAKSNLWR